MGNDKVLIHFDEEARQDDYIPYAANRHVEGNQDAERINFDFSEESHNRLDTYDVIRADDPPNFDITQSMIITEG